MNRIRNFEEFIKEGIVKIQKPDSSRAEFLMKEAEQSYENLCEQVEKLGVNRKNANNFVKICYDILMELIRAKMLTEGYNASGYGAHESEVSYLRVLGFKENDVQYTDQIRFFRNGMLYYGTMMEKDYAEKVISFTKDKYIELRK